MIVYIVVRYTPYEGGDVVSAWASQTDANNHRDKLQKLTSWYGYGVEAMEVQ